jgi:hypothetical protein
MIEIGKYYNKRITYDEAILYCFCLGDGWRLPSEAEYIEYELQGSWYVDRISQVSTFFVRPVRDIKDD